MAGCTIRAIRSSEFEFGEFCAAARRERIDLGARGFYATPGVDYNRETGRGNPFFYFTQGAAAAEVKIDRFTGELTVPRVDLLMDIGRSINPGVDMGQIIGGFIQGMGWVTAECLVYNETRRTAVALADDLQNSRHHRRAADLQLRPVPQRRQRGKRRLEQSRRRTAADARPVRVDRRETRPGLRFIRRRQRPAAAGHRRGNFALLDACRPKAEGRRQKAELRMSNQRLHRRTHPTPQ